MSTLLDPLYTLVCLGGILLIVAALLSPLEALRWWAGWSRDQLRPAELPATETEQIPEAETQGYIVYLTAIGGISAADISGRERRFLERLGAALPGFVISSDVFPFSVTNNPLNGERPLAWLWDRIHESRMRGRGQLLSGLIFLRNLFQVAVSADPRYGPIYNVGVAREIARSLVRKGYEPRSGKPISILGWSGGGQIAVGVSRYLHRALEAPVYVISIGGVLTDDTAIADVEHLYHLQGAQDKYPYIGDILYPGRWPVVTYSAWNQAKRDGRITRIEPGPMRHTGRGDYFDRKLELPTGQTYLERTVEVIGELIATTAAARSSRAP